MVCNHRYVCRTNNMSTEYNKGLSSLEKLLITRVVLAFVLLGHQYVVWYDYRTCYFDQPLGNVTIFGHNVSRAYDFPPKESAPQFANLSKKFDGNNNDVHAVHVKDVPKWSDSVSDHTGVDFASDQYLANDGYVVAAMTIAVLMVVAYLILSLLAMVSVCTESTTMSKSVAVIWGALFFIDLILHLVFNPIRPQPHFILGATSLVLLTWSAILIKTANSYIISVGGY